MMLIMPILFIELLPPRFDRPIDEAVPTEKRRVRCHRGCRRRATAAERLPVTRPRTVKCHLSKPGSSSVLVSTLAALAISAMLAIGIFTAHVEPLDDRHLRQLAGEAAR